MPFRILSRPTAMRRLRVTFFLADVTQQIHSLRANGVNVAHSSATAASEAIALRKSAGMRCTAPEAIVSLAMMPAVYSTPSEPADQTSRASKEPLLRALQKIAVAGLALIRQAEAKSSAQ